MSDTPAPEIPADTPKNEEETTGPGNPSTPEEELPTTAEVDAALGPVLDDGNFDFPIKGLTPEQQIEVTNLVNEAVAKERARHDTAAVPEITPLAAYKFTDPVEVYFPETTAWLPGSISEITENATHIHVQTERGPVTVGTPCRIRKRV